MPFMVRWRRIHLRRSWLQWFRRALGLWQKRHQMLHSTHLRPATQHLSKHSLHSLQRGHHRYLGEWAERIWERQRRPLRAEACPQRSYHFHSRDHLQFLHHHQQQADLAMRAEHQCMGLRAEAADQCTGPQWRVYCPRLCSRLSTISKHKCRCFRCRCSTLIWRTRRK